MRYCLPWHVKVSPTYCINCDHENKNILLRKHGCREIRKGLGLVLCKGVNTHWVYMILVYDCKVFSRGVIRYLLEYM